MLPSICDMPKAGKEQLRQIVISTQGRTRQAQLGKLAQSIGDSGQKTGLFPVSAPQRASLSVWIVKSTKQKARGIPAPSLKLQT